MTEDDIIDLADKAGSFSMIQYGVTSAKIEWLQKFADLVATREREKVAAWMIHFGFATGHGDTTFSDFCPKQNPDALTAALFQAQTAAISLAHKVKMYEIALDEIAWSNNSKWQQDRAKHVLAQMRGVEI